MSNPILLAQSDGSISSLQGSINDALTDLTIGAITRVNIDYGNDKNRIGLFYQFADDGAPSSNDFEVIANSNSSLNSLVSDVNADIASEQAQEDQLLPTCLACEYGNDKHRIVVALTPAAVNNGNAELTYELECFSASNIDTLTSDFNSWVSENPNCTVIDQCYYYGDSKNRSVVLYSYTPDSDAK